MVLLIGYILKITKGSVLYLQREYLHFILKVRKQIATLISYRFVTTCLRILLSDSGVMPRYDAIMCCGMRWARFG